jgi:hypothetical protein
VENVTGLACGIDRLVVEIFQVRRNLRRQHKTQQRQRQKHFHSENGSSFPRDTIR